MGNFSSDLIAILEFLLPGFVAAWLFYSLTSYAKPSQFERVIQALIFTLFVQAIVVVLKFIFVKIGNFWAIGLWTDSASLIISILVAIIFGVVFSNYANNDKIHSFLRSKELTRETSFPSEWFGSFLKNVTFVVLHLKDERRLYGWPIEWPSEPVKGHFLIADPSWLLEDGSEARIVGVSNILIDVQEIKWVEFLEKTWEKNNG